MRSRVSALLCILLALVALPAPALADTSSDIPGIPLPAPLVTGSLGGPIYDVVYRLDVPPAHVVVAGLTGTPGTDFDLYLFQPGSTTVVGNIGVVAKSTGPTSTESISYPSRLGGTYYLDLNGATNVEGAYRLSVQIVSDPTPPVITSVLLDGGAQATSDPNVSVLTVASDDISGVSSISFSSDGLTFGPWTPYSGVASWVLPPGEGTKTLWVKVQNGVGLESDPVSASITFDTTPPSVVSVSPPQGAIVTDPRPIIRVAFSEPIDPVSWATVGFALQGATGAIVPGTLSYDPSTMSGTFTPDVDLVPGALYFATIGAVRDIAGNQVTATPSWTIERLLGASISLAASAPTVTYGTSVVLSGKATTPPDEGLTLMAQTASASDFTTAAQVLPDPTFSLPVNPSDTTVYRLDYAGSSTVAPASSRLVTVAVRWWAVLSGSGPAVVRTARTGQTVTVQARIGPAKPGETVSLRLYRYDSRSGRWVYTGSHGTRTDANGIASYQWRPTAGRWRWQAVVYADAGHVSASTRLYTWSVR